MQAPVLSPSGAHSFEWTSPGSPIRVALDLRVVEGIQRSYSSVRNHAALTKQGVLLGETMNGITRIAGIRPVAGVPGDIIAAAETKGPLVGLYFVRLGDALQLSDVETAAARRLCEQRSAVVLLVCLRERAPLVAPAEATFFFFEGDFLRGGHMQFPFDAAVLSQAKAAVAAASVPERCQTPPRPPLRTAELPPLPPVDNPSAATPPDKLRSLAGEDSRALLPSGRRAVPWSRGTTVTLLVLAAIACGSALAFMFRVGPAAAKSEAAPVAVAIPVSAATEGRVAVHAERQGSDLKITWDQPIGSPDSTGTLSITDGATHRLLPLDFAQLRLASLLYAPASDQVRVELTISHADQVYARGSVLVVISGQAPPVVRQDPAPAVPRAAASAPSAPAEPEAQKQESVELRRPARFFQAGPTVAKAAPSSAGIDLPLPPPVSGQPAAQVQTQPLNIRAEPLMPAPPPVQYATVAYTEAVPVYKVMPVQPPELRAVFGPETNVRVKVQIDNKGRVTKADPVLEKGVHQLVAAAAARAALGWKFTPAHIGDRAVPSEMTLEFRFRRR